MFRKIRPIICLVGLALSLAACQTTDPYTGETKTSSATKGAIIGGASAAAVGALIDGRKGALIGLGIGALAGGMIGNYMDQQEANCAISCVEPVSASPATATISFSICRVM